MGKYAWLVMAHNQPELLKKLLRALDNKNADIFLHIDKKSKLDIQEVLGVVKESKCYPTARINVVWGYSQSAAELFLLETTNKTGWYDFYHLITGSDYLLKPVMEVQRFYEEHKDIEFISGGRVTEPKVGSAYFDISDAHAIYLVDRKSEIRRRFSATRCADEMFLQTMFYNSLLTDSHRVYRSGEKHPYIQTLYLDVKRAIHWKRGTSYVWRTDEDYEILKIADAS